MRFQVDKSQTTIQAQKKSVNFVYDEKELFIFESGVKKTCLPFGQLYTKIHFSVSGRNRYKQNSKAYYKFM